MFKLVEIFTYLYLYIKVSISCLYKSHLENQNSCKVIQYNNNNNNHHHHLVWNIKVLEGLGNHYGKTRLPALGSYHYF